MLVKAQVSIQFNKRMYHKGDIFVIPDTKVSKEKVINSNPGRRGNQDQEISEFELRQLQLKRGAVKCSKAEQELYLEFKFFSPDQMEIAPKGAKVTTTAKVQPIEPTQAKKAEPKNPSIAHEAKLPSVTHAKRTFKR